ncbi:TATA box-binding protein-associated factor RNA polymerase I subunit C [Aplochiton taeniatus]
MDYTFPSQLFPSYFNSGPPNLEIAHSVGGWGSYGQALCANKDGPMQPDNWRFATQHQVKGETWSPVEPIVVPMQQPGRGNAGILSSSTASNPQDFSKHMENFYLGNFQDAFGTMSNLLGENFYFEKGKRKKCERHVVHMWQTKDFMDKLAYKKCEYSSMPESIKKYSSLLDDVIPDVPPDLLAGLLYEELSHQSELEQFSDSATGGALAYIPFRQNSRATTHGCLMYPADSGFSSLYLHKVSLKCLEGNAPCINSKKYPPFPFRLNGTIRQISTGVQMNECHVGVRSDYMCGVVSVSEKTKPRLLQVVQTKEPATCLTVSPHVLGELLVATESGAAYLWRLGEGLQRCRTEDGNLYFNARSPWRWCDFSGHPRVVVYSDRTGVELTDIRTKQSSSHTLFRIGQTPACKRWERVILPKYLREVHTFHHLVTTQHSAYILDERFPCIPMLKWDHMMEYPPMFAHVLAGPSSCSSGGGVNKILLGSQCSQELTLLQYSGGREVACCSRGPPQALLKPRDSLHHLPVQLPHRLHAAQQRLAQPAAGLTCIQQKGGEECICVLQLTDAGDIFYQTLRPQTVIGVPEERTAEHVLSRARPEWPSKGPLKHVSRAKERTLSGMSLASRDDSGSKVLEVVINDEPDPATMDLSDAEINCSQEVPIISLPSGPSVINRPPPPKMSGKTLRKWKRWLLKLVQQGKKKQGLQHCTVETKGLLNLPGNTAAVTQQKKVLGEDRRQGMRINLRESMRKGELLVLGTAYLPPLDPVAVPCSIDLFDWTDDLSQRLAAGWDGGWKGWWEEKLGMNREEKEEALRKKRRRQKQSRAHRRSDLSGSFTSSVSYQSNLDFSGGSGWSSAASYGAWSDIDVDSRFSNSQVDNWSELWPPTAASPPPTPLRRQQSTTCNEQQPSQQTVPHKPQPQQQQQQTPMTSLAQPHRAEVEASLAAVSRPQGPAKPKRPSEDYLSSLFGSQEASQSHVLEDGDMAFSGPLAASSQLSRLSASQSTPRRGLSLSQSSQPKRKKSRMGF